MRTVSILLPTLNAERVLGKCLQSIDEQDYPKELVEIIIADGGSTDNTLEIARQYTDRIYPNPLKTGEAGKAVALKRATGEIVALIDSDNILPSQDWMRRMMEPFEDEEIMGAEPWEYTCRAEDRLITRYCALMGMNDPICLFLGNYDRLNQITQKWTQMPVTEEDAGRYLKVTLDEKHIPTIGANGFLIRRVALQSCQVEQYLFDIDILCELVQRGQSKVAKVKIGIVHLFSGNVATFTRKQRRRIWDFHFYSRLGLRKYPWSGVNRTGLIRFLVYTITTFPLLVQALIGYIRKPDSAWLFHPLACWITLWTYGIGTLQSRIDAHEMSRNEWSQ